MLCWNYYNPQQFCSFPPSWLNTVLGFQYILMKPGCEKTPFSTILSGKIHHSITQRQEQTTGIMCLWKIRKCKPFCKEIISFDLFSFLISFPSSLPLKGWTSAASLPCNHHFSAALVESAIPQVLRCQHKSSIPLIPTSIPALLPHPWSIHPC